jgi:enoyl-CoA hydratase
MCSVTGVRLDPGAARDAGFLDRVVEPDALIATAREVAGQLADVDANAHAATKVRIRKQLLGELRDGIERLADGREP